MEPLLRAAIDELRADSISGASELLPRAIGILRLGLERPFEELVEAARDVGRAQPSMAPLWNAALAALAERRSPGALGRFDQRRRRAGRAMVRVALDELLLGGQAARHVVTISFSGSVLACLRAIGAVAPLRVSCAEGRPGLEGRRLAAKMAGAGIAVEFYGDAALGGALGRGAAGETVVLVGADAVTPAWALNKSGTTMLAAAAGRAGVPVYVAATRDKFADRRVAALLEVAERDGREIWDAPPPGVAVRNAVFERVPADLVSGVITDAGVLPPGMLEEACRAASADVEGDDVEALL